MEIPLPIAIEYYILKYLASAIEQIVSTLEGVVDVAPQIQHSVSDASKTANQKHIKLAIIA